MAPESRFWIMMHGMLKNFSKENLKVEFNRADRVSSILQ